MLKSVGIMTIVDVMLVVVVMHLQLIQNFVMVTPIFKMEPEAVKALVVLIVR